MPEITDWLMVAITTVYVLATIFICWANMQSAKASKRQLDEIRRQYAEENRPNIEVEFLYEKRLFYGLRFVNTGKYTAYHVKIEFDPAFLEHITEEGFAESLCKQKGKECVIGIGQHYDLFFGTNEYRNNPDKAAAKGVIHYEGSGTVYQSEFCIDLDHYATIFSVPSEQEEWKEKLNEIDRHLKGIEKAIRELSFSSVFPDTQNYPAKE